MSDSHLDLDQLIASAIEDARDGEISPERLEEVRSLLASSAEARKAYLKHNQLSRALATASPWVAPERVTTSGWLASIGSMRKESRRGWTAAWAACAALLLVGALRFVSTRPIGWEDRATAGIFATSHGARLNVPDLGLTLHEGDELRVGEYDLAAGRVKLDIDGVELTVESPARFRVDSKDQLAIEKGRLRFPKSQRKFRVETGTATASILPGADTGIDVDDQASEVHVFGGDVEVAPKNGEPPVRLTQARATRIELRGPPIGVDVVPDRFTRSLEEPTQKYAEAVQALGPVVYFRLGSNPDGETLINYAQQRFDEVPGKVFAGNMARPPFAPGIVGAGLRLEGAQAGAYAAYPQYPKATNAMTFCAWVRAESRPRWATIAKHWTKQGGQFHFGLGKDDGDLDIQVHDAAGNVVRVREITPFPIGSWEFVAFVVDGSELRLYRNGARIGSAPCLGLSLNGLSDLGIGVKLGEDGKPRLNAGYWHGGIDELAIYHHVLSEADLKRLFDLGTHQDASLR